MMKESIKDDTMNYHSEFKPAYNSTWRNVKEIHCKIWLETKSGKRYFDGIIKEIRGY